MAEAELAERPVENAVARENQAPRVDTDEVARPERQQNQHEQDRLETPRRQPGCEIGERKSKEHVRDGDRCCDTDRAERDVAVRRVVDQRVEVRQRPLMDDGAREGIERPECGDEERDERGNVDPDEGTDGRRQQDQATQPGTPEEGGGDRAAAGRPRRAARFSCGGAQRATP